EEPDAVEKTAPGGAPRARAGPAQEERCRGEHREGEECEWRECEYREGARRERQDVAAAPGQADGKRVIGQAADTRRRRAHRTIRHRRHAIAGKRTAPAGERRAQSGGATSPSPGARTRRSSS